MSLSRRQFIKTGSIALGSVPFISLADDFVKNQTIKVGLVGCGGRGTGAVIQALSADPDVKVTALADVYQDKIDLTLSALNKRDASRVDVPVDRQYIGFDSYKKLIDSGVDLVLLCSPPNFRPDHMEYAVLANKHIFCEKPVAVDIPGLKRVMDSVRISKERNLTLVSGFCFRYLTPNRAIMNLVKDGAIGDIRSITTFRYGGELTIQPRQADWSDFDYELRNWYYYQRYAGDLIIEQSIHSIDFMNWLMNNKLPNVVSATGGRQSKPWNTKGNTFDHFAVEFDYGNGVKGMHFARQQNGTDFRNSVEALGTNGFLDINLMRDYKIHGSSPYTYEGPVNNMYQTQHDELIQSIRNNVVLNDGDHMVNSTLLAIWAKISAYTGKRISKEEILNSVEILGPNSDAYSKDMAIDSNEIARPGLKKFI